jgi:hypothetical protein
VLWKQESFVVLRPLQIEFFRNLLESEWREMWVASGMPALEFPGKAFVGFCKKRYQMKPNP